MPAENLLYTTMSSSVGELLLAGSEENLKYIHFDSHAFVPPADWRLVDALPYPVVDQLAAYFAADLREFDLPLDLRPCRPQQLVVLHARWTGRDTSHTAEAGVEVARDGVGDVGVPLQGALDERNPAARRVGFSSPEYIRRTGRQTELTKPI